MIVTIIIRPHGVNVIEEKMGKAKALVLGIALFVVGCQPRVDCRGSIDLKECVKAFVVGVTTMGDVIQRCGTPSLHVDDFTWIYMEARAEETSFSDVVLKDRMVVKMRFGRNKVLKSIEEVRQPTGDKVPMDKEISDLASVTQVDKKLNHMLSEG